MGCASVATSFHIVSLSSPLNALASLTLNQIQHKGNANENQPTNLRSSFRGDCCAGGMPKDANMRQRWDALWNSGFDVARLYSEGLDDNHIDTALRTIGQEQQAKKRAAMLAAYGKSDHA
jgi:hypothetical protein